MTHLPYHVYDLIITVVSEASRRWDPSILERTRSTKKCPSSSKRDPPIYSGLTTARNDQPQRQDDVGLDLIGQSKATPTN